MANTTNLDLEKPLGTDHALIAKINSNMDKIIPDKELEIIEKSIRNKLKTVLGLDAKIMLESPNTLARFEGKAKRVKDLRKQ